MGGIIYRGISGYPADMSRFIRRGDRNSPDHPVNPVRVSIAGMADIPVLALISDKDD